MENQIQIDDCDIEVIENDNSDVRVVELVLKEKVSEPNFFENLEMDMNQFDLGLTSF